MISKATCGSTNIYFLNVYVVELYFLLSGIEQCQCQNGGVCPDPRFPTQCNCPPQFFGTLCESSKYLFVYLELFEETWNHIWIFYHLLTLKDQKLNHSVMKAYVFYPTEPILWLLITVYISGLGNDTLRPRQDDHHFPNDILKCIFLNENIWIALKISVKCVPKVRIYNIPALV